MGTAPQRETADPLPTNDLPITSADGVVIKQEPLDPLNMDIDDEELEYEPDKLNVELSEQGLRSGDLAGSGIDAVLLLPEYVAPPPKPLSLEARDELRDKLIASLHQDRSHREFVVDVVEDGEKSITGMPIGEMWMLLLVRMITRSRAPSIGDKSEETDEDSKNEIPPSTKVEESEMQSDEGQSPNASDASDTKNLAFPVKFTQNAEHMRRVVCDYILGDFQARYEVSAWLKKTHPIQTAIS